MAIEDVRVPEYNDYRRSAQMHSNPPKKDKTEKKAQTQRTNETKKSKTARVQTV